MNQPRNPYRDFAVKVQQRYGLGDWFSRQINQESGFTLQPNPNSSGAAGIAQIVPRWHPDAPPASDPYGQLDWAGKYMSGLVKKYGGNVSQALSVYNSGRPNAYQDPKFAGGQTYNYVRNILGGSGAGGAGTVAAGPAPSASVSSGFPQSTGINRNAVIMSMLNSLNQPDPKQQSLAMLGAVMSLRQQQAQAQSVMAPQLGPNLGSFPVQAGGGTQGMNPEFQRRLNLLMKAVPGLTITSGYRSPQEQSTLWQAALRKYGSAEAARKWVAPPGHSRHNMGLAADMRGDLARAHALAAQYGLVFPLSNENWHIEMAGAR